MPLAKIAQTIAAIKENITQASFVLLEHNIFTGITICDNTVREGILASKQLRAKWAANGIAAYSIGKNHAFRGEPVQARSDNGILIHIAYGLSSELVWKHKNEIWFFKGF
jgi:hypothetical protein